MKVCVALALVATLGIASGYVVPATNDLTSSEEREVRRFLTEYKRSAKEYILQQLNSIASESCDGTIPDFERPLEETIDRLQEIDVEEETLCSLVRKHLVHVSQPLTRTFDACLPNDEAGVASWAVQAVTSITDYICKTDGEHILELVNPCVANANVLSCVENAADRWNEITKSDSQKTFKEETCSEYNDVRPCFVKEIHTACKLPTTRESVVGLLDAAFLSSCPV